MGNLPSDLIPLFNIAAGEDDFRTERRQPYGDLFSNTRGGTCDDDALAFHGSHYYALSEKNLTLKELCHFEGAFFRERRVSLATVGILRFAQNDMAVEFNIRLQTFRGPREIPGVCSSRGQDHQK